MRGARGWWCLASGGVMASVLLVAADDVWAARRRRCCQPVYSRSMVAPCAPAAMSPAVSTYEAPPPPSTEPTGTKSLYERLGGEAAIKAVVDEFVAIAAADEKVNFFRKGTGKEWQPGEQDVIKLKKHLVDMIGSVTGGPQKYTGRSMKEAHAGMKITEGEFHALAADLIAALDKFKVPQAEKDELIKIVATTKGEIVEGP